LLPPLTLLILACVAHSAGLTGEWLFDDFDTLELETSRSAVSPLDGRPLVAWTFAWQRRGCGAEPLPYHAFNLGVHALTTLLIWAWLFRAERRHDDGAGVIAPASLSWWAAALWTVHPLQSEAVTYITQRTELMMGCAFVALFWLFECALGANAARRLIWQAAAVLVAALGMMCKETMAVAPAVLLIYDRCLAAGSWRTVWRLRGRFYGALASSYGVLALSTWGARGETAGPSAAITVGDYLLSQAAIVSDYLRLAIWPDGLCFDYGPAYAPVAAAAAPRAFGLAATLLVALFWAVRRPRHGFWIGWFLLTLAPTSSVVPILTEVGAERRMYLPLLGLVLLVLYGARRLVSALTAQAGTPARIWAQRLLVVSGAVLLAAASHATYQRELLYQDAELLWRDAAARRPANARAFNNLGETLARRGRYSHAIEPLEQALRIDAKYGNAHYNLGVIRARMGEFERAAHHFREVTQGDINDAEAFFWRGVVHEHLCELGKAIIAYGRTLRLDAGHLRALNNLAWIHATHGDREQRNASLALELVAKALDQAGMDPPAFLIDTHAAALASAGRFEEARQRMEQLIRIASEKPWGSKVLSDLLARRAAYDRGEAVVECSGNEHSAKRRGAPFQGALRDTLQVP
jgi:tetratricopeptide (TPR) repeat protein